MDELTRHILDEVPGRMMFIMI